MKDQKQDLFWVIYAHVYDLVRFLPSYQNLLKDVEIAANLKSNTNVLDAGCGTGNFIKQTALAYKVKFIGIDLSGPMLAQANKKLNGIKNITIQKGNLNEKLPFSDNFFQSIIAINSVYAVSNPEFTFSELMRVLKPSGTLVIVNPQAKASFIAAYLEILNSGKGLGKLFLFVVTIPLFFFNLLIKMKASKKSFHFLSQDDWKRMINRFTITSMHIKDTYMQSYMLQIVKK